MRPGGGHYYVLYQHSQATCYSCRSYDVFSKSLNKNAGALSFRYQHTICDICSLPNALETANCPSTLQIPHIITRPPSLTILSRSSWNLKKYQQSLRARILCF